MTETTTRKAGAIRRRTPIRLICSLETMLPPVVVAHMFELAILFVLLAAFLRVMSWIYGVNPP